MHDTIGIDISKDTLDIYRQSDSRDFGRAVRQGMRPDGVHLYPAMPCASYRGASDEDMQALRACGAAMLLMIFGRVLGTAGLLAGLPAPSSGSTFACDGAVLLSMVNGPLAPLALPRNSRSAEQDSYGSAPPAERMSTSGTQRRGPVPGPGAWA